MKAWQRNLYVLCAALFVVMLGMSMVMPFLPLYIQKDFGVTDPHEVTAWAGIIFWGQFSDSRTGFTHLGKSGGQIRTKDHDFALWLFHVGDRRIDRLRQFNLDAIGAAPVKWHSGRDHSSQHGIDRLNCTEGTGWLGPRLDAVICHGGHDHGSAGGGAVG